MSLSSAVLLALSALFTADPEPLSADGPQSLWRAQGYNCANTTCKQISSCEEACYKLQICGHYQRDGDNDGIPCENLCSQPCG